MSGDNKPALMVVTQVAAPTPGSSASWSLRGVNELMLACQFIGCQFCHFSVEVWKRGHVFKNNCDEIKLFTQQHW